MKPSKPANEPKVTPPASWVERSKYGLLRDVGGNPYVCLEDVHAQLMEREGLTSLQAANRVISPFVSDAASALGMEHGAEKLRPFLGVADLADRVGGLDAYALKNLGRWVPYVHHHGFDKGTPQALLYALAVMAADVWAPHSDSLDLPDRLGSAYAIDGNVPSADKAREILGSLVVRHELAHKLWGWGTVDAAAVDANAASAPLVAKQKKVPQREQAPEWTGVRLKARRDELIRNGEKKPTQVLMVESALKEREIRRRISKNDAGSAAMAGMASQLEPKKPKAA